MPDIGKSDNSKLTESRLTMLNKCLLSFDIDPVANINRLAKLCGEQLGAVCALYNRLEDGMLCALGQWNAPPDLIAQDRPEGHICFEVIQDASTDIRIIRNLQETTYAETDPNVRKYGLQTYIGKAVSFGGVHVGSICVVYQTDHAVTAGEKEFLEIIASAIGVEEMRRAAKDDMLVSEENFRALSQQFNAILDLMPDIVALLTPDLRVIWVNKAASNFGKSPAEVIGSTCYTLWHHADTECEICPVRKSLDTGKAASATISAPDGLVWDIRTIPLKNTEGKVISIVEVSRDITGHRKLEEQLRQSQKMEAVGQIAGGIAHDFNNMLCAMLGFSTLTQLKLKPDDPASHYLEEINKLVERGSSLTKSLLAFSRKQVLTMKPVSLTLLIGAFAKLLQRVIGEDILLDIRLAPDDSVIMADSGQIDQILLNLATNARDAMPNGGTLTIGTRAQYIDDEFVRIHGYGSPGPYALITVEDTGSGIDRLTREKIFEPFFTTKEVGKGTGLGLSIVYGIVTQHNGFISVYSEPGKGAAFRILLPAINVKPDEIVLESREAMSGSSDIILLAEDDTAVREVIKTLLTEMGYEVIEAIDGQQAVEKFRQHSETIRLVLMDMIMPALSGLEAFEEIRKIKSDAKVLFMSGYTADYIKLKMDISESLRLIVKPIAPRELLKTIREIINA